MGQQVVDVVADEGGDEEDWEDDGEDDEYAAEGQARTTVTGLRLRSDLLRPCRGNVFTGVPLGFSGAFLQGEWPWWCGLTIHAHYIP